MVISTITACLPSEPLKFRTSEFRTSCFTCELKFLQTKENWSAEFCSVIYLLSGHPYLCKTKLGYIIAGKLSLGNRRTDRHQTWGFIWPNRNDILHGYLERFLKVEEFPRDTFFHALSKEQACELHFTKTTKWTSIADSSSAYHSRYQHRSDSHESNTAERRFKSLERRIAKKWRDAKWLHNFHAQMKSLIT